MEFSLWRHKSGEWVSHTLGIMSTVLAKVGPRPSGSPESRETAGMLADEIRPYVNKVELESFKFARHPFLAFLKWQSSTYILATAALFMGWPWAAAGLILVGAVVTVAQFVLYKEFLDPLYPKVEGINMIATVEPDEEVKRQVVIGGHHDSAFVFRFLQWTPRLYPIHVLFANVFIWLAIAAVPTWAILELFGVTPFYDAVLPWIMVAGIPIVGSLWFLVSKDVTPGAGDNLVASAGLIALAKALAEHREQGHFKLRNTRVIFASFDGEESGLRGSRAYVKRHLEGLTSVPTELFNIDSVYEVDDLRFIVKDINGTMPLSKSMGRECVAMAQKLGFTSSILSMPLGSGATDAGEFARFGIPSTTLIAMSSKAIPPKGFPYHALRDTMEVVKPEAVRAMLEVTWAMLVSREAPAAVEPAKGN